MKSNRPTATTWTDWSEPGGSFCFISREASDQFQRSDRSQRKEGSIKSSPARRLGRPGFRFGIERLLARRPRWLGTARIGLVSHPASVDCNLVHSADRLHSVAGKRLIALFGPQHGARGEKQDNMVESDDYRDHRLGIPVYSLYGKVR